MDYESPAWNTGLRRGPQLLQINGEKASASLLTKVINAARPGDKINITVAVNNDNKNTEITLGSKTEKSFKITPAENADSSQKQILESWLKG